MEQLCYLKDIISDTEQRLSLIKENKENLDSKLIELYELRKNYCSHFKFQKDLIFKDILKKYKNKKQLLEFLNSLFERIDITIFDVNIDLNNINFTIFDNQIENIKKDICFYNSEKKIKLKELEMIKKYLNGLSVYKKFKRDFKNSIFDQYYTKNRNKILKNLGNTSFIKQYINDKYYKLKFSRCLLKDEFQYKEYQKEEECIKNSLIELELNIIEQQNLLDNLNTAKKRLLNLKNEDFFIKELNSFFIENFDIEHAKLINNKKFNKYYFNYKVISLILNNLKNEILLLDNFYNQKWKFFKKIRCFQYTQKHKSFELKKDEIESEIFQYIENLYNQYKICKKIININLDIIDQVHINNEQDFLLFLHDEFQLNVHNSFNIKNNEKEDFINIFKNNIMYFNYIKF